MGSAAAVSALMRLKTRRGWNLETLAREIGTTARTLNTFSKTHEVRISVFITMAANLNITPEQLLRGEVPGTE